MRLLDTPGGGYLPAGFLELPHKVYQGDPNWIPEDPARVVAAFGAGNPWFEHGRAHAFCVPSKARAAAFLPDGLVIDDAPAAFFGYWESVGDQHANALVMEAVRAWATAEGAQRLVGPVNFSTAGDYRVVLSNGEPYTPFVGEPYNPPSYAGQLEALGFELHTRYLTHVLDTQYTRASVEDRGASLDHARAAGYRFQALDVEAWGRHSAELHELANVAFASNLGFMPISSEQFAVDYDTAWAATLDPEASVLAHGPDGDVAGALLIYPHYAPLVVQGAGADRMAVRSLSYAEHATRLAALGESSLVARTAWLGPAHRSRGVGMAMSVESQRRALEKGLTSMIAGLFREDNPSRRLVQRGRRPDRWYGVYASDLPSNGGAS